MMRESPTRISACMILPSGPTARLVSSAPSAFLYQSIACAALSSVNCGVTVWCPSGIAFFALAMFFLLHCTRSPPFCGGGDRAATRFERLNRVIYTADVHEKGSVHDRPGEPFVARGCAIRA